MTWSRRVSKALMVRELSRWLGHKSITTTVDLYGTWSPRPAAVPATRSIGRSPIRACAPKVPTAS